MRVVADFWVSFRPPLSIPAFRSAESDSDPPNVRSGNSLMGSAGSSGGSGCLSSFLSVPEKTQQ